MTTQIITTEIIKEKKTKIVRTPNYLTLELLSQPNFKSITVFAALALLAFGSTNANAAELTAGATASIPPVSQRAEQYSSETVARTFDRTNANSETGRIITGQTTITTPNGIVPTNGQVRAYIQDNARLNGTRVPLGVNSGAPTGASAPYQHNRAYTTTTSNINP